MLGVTTEVQALRRIQEALKTRLGPDLRISDELLADRRREAATEDGRDA